MSNKSIVVTAAIIRQAEYILICQRAEVGSCSYLWEFPGGKLETGETLEECLVRECQEELGITLKITGIFSQSNFNDGEKELMFTFFHAEIESGQPKCKVHHDLRWVKITELQDYAFCPADVEIVERLMTC